MANPLRDEELIYKRIEEEGLKVDPDLWTLINHHVRNDLSYISCWIGILRMTPDWILNDATERMKKLFEESGEKGSPPPDLSATFDETLARVQSVNEFLLKLRDLTIDKENSK